LGIIIFPIEAGIDALLGKGKDSLVQTIPELMLG
jgi:hypothetical protein